MANTVLPLDPLLVVLGATGTGKSQLAVDLATRFNGEIINGDAMQMYDGLPILTNKITAEEQKGIPHHLLGFIALDKEPWRVGLFKKKASQIIQEIRSRGRLPIVVGGTHYYTQSLLFEDSLVTEQADEQNLPSELSNQEISEKFPILDGPTETMIQRLREIDPLMADRWHPNDRRKIRRSLEIFLLTGRKASEIYAEQMEGKSLNSKACSAVEEEASPQFVSSNWSTLLFWVHSDSDILKKRLDDRVDKMMEAGLLDEVKSMNDFLHKQVRVGVTVDRSRGIWVSIGWKQFKQYLAALETRSVSQETLDNLVNQSIEQTKSATCQYAKRQTRWIRLKLMPALSNGNALDRLYLLDGSDVAQWSEAVSNPSMEITQRFLAGYELPAPTQLSDAAKQFLAPEGSLELLDRRELRTRQECEMCNVVTVTEDQWQSHLKSRRHRSLIKKRLKDANSRSPLPKSDSKLALSDTC